MAARDHKVAESRIAPELASKLAPALIALKERSAAKLVEALIPKDELPTLGPEHGLSPLPGKRWKTMTSLDHALCVFRGLKEPSKHQAALMAAVLRHVPPPAEGIDPETCVAGDELVESWLSLPRDSDHATRLRTAVALLLDPNRRDRLTRALESDFLAPPETKAASEPVAEDPKDAEIRRLEAKITRIEEESRAEQAAALERERAWKLRMEQTQAELEELRQRLRKSHREIEELRANYETAKGDLELAFRRAARFKQSLDETKAASEREKELLDAYTREKLRADIEASKVEILEYELDVLAHDDEPSSPPPAPDAARNAAVERIRRYEATHGGKPRILIVGGAGKQRSHRDRDFEAMKVRLGIEGEWRFADYGSWHRELPRLRNDIQHRFDLVFVLHWNRTTFVQKMHDEARALNGRVRTVPYRGFLSLERAIAEEVDRFVSERD